MKANKINSIELEKKIKIVKLNIFNLKSWLAETPNDEDYLKCLSEYEAELKELEGSQNK